MTPIAVFNVERKPRNAQPGVVADLSRLQTRIELRGNVEMQVKRRRASAPGS